MPIEKLTNSITAQLDLLRQFTSTPGQGVTRFPFTKEARQASDTLIKTMEDLGLQVRMDNSGSVIGRLEGQVPETIMIGSHLDSVRHGGAYDGIAGVVCGIEAARTLLAEGFNPYYSLEVIATNDEEGSRFRAGLFTPKVLLGQMSVEAIQQLKDADGVSIYQAMEAYGLKPQEIDQHTRDDIKAFIEIHIEQGPVLEAGGEDIGVVDVIVGIRRLMVTLTGRADHVGTMPMDMRMDALEAASKVIANIGDRAREYPDAVATVGFLSLEPNIMNIIPSQVSFAVDIRGTRPDIIEGQHQGLLKDLDEITQRFSMHYQVDLLLDAAPVRMDPNLGKGFDQALETRGYTYRHLNSGAGHDAQIFGQVIPTAMLFVPSLNGRSHCPEEFSDARTLALATRAACDVITRLNEERSL